MYGSDSVDGLSPAGNVLLRRLALKATGAQRRPTTGRGAGNTGAAMVARDQPGPEVEDLQKVEDVQAHYLFSVPTEGKLCARRTEGSPVQELTPIRVTSNDVTTRQRKPPTGWDEGLQYLAYPVFVIRSPRAPSAARRRCGFVLLPSVKPQLMMRHDALTHLLDK